jgi:hypothetical protein
VLGNTLPVKTLRRRADIFPHYGMLRVLSHLLQYLRFTLNLILIRRIIQIQVVNRVQQLSVTLHYGCSFQYTQTLTLKYADVRFGLWFRNCFTRSKERGTSCEIRGCHSVDCKDSGLLGCYAQQLGCRFPTFRGNLRLHLQGTVHLKKNCHTSPVCGKSSRTPWPLKMKAIRWGAVTHTLMSR